MDDRFQLILGASSGLGKRLAEKFVQRDQKVILVSRKPISDGTFRTPNSFSLAADLSREEGRQTLMNLLISKNIKLDAVYFCWSKMFGRSFDSATKNDISQVLDSNVFAPTILLQELLSRGSVKKIVLIGSEAAFYPIPQMGIYCASKSYLYQLGLSLHEDWKARGVCIQIYIPPAMDTEFDSIYFKDIRKKIRRVSPEFVAQHLFQSKTNDAAEIFYEKKIKWSRFFTLLFPTAILLKILKGQFR